jgi:predicted MFS family arabinose efflux permease
MGRGTLTCKALSRMTYLAEIRAKWRVVLATSLGQASGYSIVTYINNVFTPHLLKEFGWSKSNFALVGVALFFGFLIQPITGRLGDSFGVRRVALVGVIGGPLVFVGLSLMTGSLWQFFALTLLHLIFTSGATSVVIYSRLIAKNLDLARGVCLAIAASAAPAVAALCVPSLGRFIDEHGWRMGYLVVAACTAIGGVLALLLIPASADVVERVKLKRQESPTDYRSILRSRPLQLLIGSVFLCLLSFTLQTTQLKVVLMERGIDSAAGSLAISLFATSTIVGRLLCGVALDRFPAYGVAALFLGLPGVGLALLAVGPAQPAVMSLAVGLLGLSMGSEGDVWAYLVAKYFRAEVYGTVLGLVLCAMALSTGIGALLLSQVLQLNRGYTPFLVASAVLVFIGSGLLLFLRDCATNRAFPVQAQPLPE